MAEEAVATTTGAETTATSAAATTTTAAAATTAAATTTTAATPTWRDDWRNAMATVPDDLKTLERFTDPKAQWESHKALRNRLASGEIKAVTPFPKDGDDAAKNQWRKDQGLPETPDKYDITGIEVPEGEKPIVDAYLKAAHDIHLSPDQAKALLTARAGIMAKQQQDAADAYTQAVQTTSDKLNAEWGTDYRRNMQVIEGMIAGHLADADLKASVMRAVNGNHEYARFMAAIALKINPTATLHAAGTEGAPGGLEARLAEIKTMMTKDRKAYNDPKISGTQGEYPRLLEAYQRVHGKPYPG